jgi:hypothetical protein
MLELVIGACPARLSWAKQRHDRLAKRRRHMHGAGVIADHQLAQTNPFDHLGQGKLRGQVEASPDHSRRDAFSQLSLLRPTQDGELQVGALIR